MNSYSNVICACNTTLFTDAYCKGTFVKQRNQNSVQSVLCVVLYELRTSGLLECTLQDEENFIFEVS